MKPLIGILANMKTNEIDGPYADYYLINKLYVDRVKEKGGIPVGILDVESLDKFDEFLLIGGHRITESHYKVIEYCIKNNKPLLGICNGMQAIVSYARLYEECVKSNIEPTPSNLCIKYDELRKNNIPLLVALENHGTELSKRKVELTEENLNRRMHGVNIKENSILFDIYKKPRVNVYSIHTYGVYEVEKSLEILALSDDNVVEAVRYKDKPIIGVQFHPEIDAANVLIESFIKAWEV